MNADLRGARTGDGRVSGPGIIRSTPSRLHEKRRAGHPRAWGWGSPRLARGTQPEHRFSGVRSGSRAGHPASPGLPIVVAACALAAWLLGSAGMAAQARPTIVSLVPAVTEMLFAIGAGPQVIGVSSYDRFPAEATRLPKMGALLDPNTEAILAARPGLVISYGSQADLQAQLSRAGIGVFSYRHAGLAGIFESLRELGAASGHAAEAARLTASLRGRLDAVRARTAGLPHPTVLLVMGREPMTLRNLNASGGVGFLHEVLEIAGGTNVFADVKKEAVTVSSEMLLARAPAVILDLHYGATEPASRARAIEDAAVWRTVASVPAVKQGRVLPLYGDRFVVPGPRIAEAAEAMARALHPEAFR